MGRLHFSSPVTRGACVYIMAVLQSSACACVRPSFRVRTRAHTQRHMRAHCVQKHAHTHTGRLFLTHTRTTAHAAHAHTHTHTRAIYADTSSCALVYLFFSCTTQITNRYYRQHRPLSVLASFQPAARAVVIIACPVSPMQLSNTCSITRLR
jgi:hypothetical protein